MRNPFPSVKPNGGARNLGESRPIGVPAGGGEQCGWGCGNQSSLLCGCRCVKAGGIWGRWGLWGSIPRGHILSLGRRGCFNFWACSRRAVGSLGNRGLAGAEGQGQRASGLRGQEDTQASCAETTKEQAQGSSRLGPLPLPYPIH